MDDIRTVFEIKDVPAKFDGGPTGQMYEEIVLKPQVFAIWKPDGAHDQMVKDALARAIAEKMEYDVDVSRDLSDGRVMAKASTTVYMKADNIEMNSTINSLKNQIDELKITNKEKLEKMKELLIESELANQHSISKWMEFSDKYYILKSKNRNSKYLFKRLMRALKTDIKSSFII